MTFSSMRELFNTTANEENPEEKTRLRDRLGLLERLVALEKPPSSRMRQLDAFIKS